MPSYLATIEQGKALNSDEAPDERLLAAVRALAPDDARYWLACALMTGAAKISDALVNRFLAVAAPGRSLTSGSFYRASHRLRWTPKPSWRGWPSRFVHRKSCEHSSLLRPP
ncbi:MAG: hypothetical protein JOZ19_03645 [Rubrobacter sp.]|nr:hypothetical protein [Rubrobacter sp.]